jgi:NAD(P)-dependent dehydrogenase (short-subunit alcohol dehydrogenase family)
MQPPKRDGLHHTDTNREEGLSGTQLRGQTVLVIGGSAGVGLETARLARAEGADVIITARDPDRVHRAGLELGAGIAAFDATDFDRLEKFFGALASPIDHVLVAGGYDGDVDRQLLLPVNVARNAKGKVRPGGTVLFIGVTDCRRPPALPALTKNLALELAPVRVNLIATGFVDTPSPPSDVAALAVHLMTNPAISGATLDVDGFRRRASGGGLD